jgi:DNA-binding XRE family transcriptional regulator
MSPRQPWADDDFAGPLAIHIGRRIRWLRRDQELSQEALAWRASISRDEIYRIELRSRLPRIDTLIKIAGALGVSVPLLIDGVTWKVVGEMGRPVWMPADPRYGCVGPCDPTRRVAPVDGVSADDANGRKARGRR